jgi:hypothetical protein
VDGDHGAGRGEQLVDRGDLEVGDGVLVVALGAKMLAEDVVGDREEVGAEAGLLAEAISTLDAAEEGALDQVVDAVADLVGEEAADRLEVALKEEVAGVAVASAPGVEEVKIGRDVDDLGTLAEERR